VTARVDLGVGEGGVGLLDPDEGCPKDLAGEWCSRLRAKPREGAGRASCGLARRLVVEEGAGDVSYVLGLGDAWSLAFRAGLSGGTDPGPFPWSAWLSPQVGD
jgi:hypothetical protein